MTISFHTLGCKLNYAETSTYERAFVAAGFQVVPSNKVADVYLINTCSVTQHSDNKCRNIIRKCHKLAPKASIIVTGCYAELKREEVAALEGVALVFGASEKKNLVPQSLAFLAHADVDDGSDVADVAAPAPDASAGSSDASAQASFSVHADVADASSVASAQPSVADDGLGGRNGVDLNAFAAYSSGERTRSFLKVQDGCNNFCAYCTVPYARGRSRNVPVCELVKQAEAIAAEGIKEIVLTGVNTGDFGRTTGESFLELLKALNGVDGIERYRISSIEPNLLTEEIIDWIASGTKFQPHFHIPLQVGDDELLAKMGRKYDTALFASRIDYVRARMGEKVFFGIDVIVGLPGESDEKFDKTFDFLAERIRPAYIHIFPYSRRPGTRAAKMKEQVQDSIKTQRVKKLEALCEQLHSAFCNSCKGSSAQVLWESKDKDGMMSGYTGNYIRVQAPYERGKVGTIETVIL